MSDRKILVNTRFCNFSSDWRHELIKCYRTIQKILISFLMQNYLFKKRLSFQTLCVKNSFNCVSSTVISIILNWTSCDNTSLKLQLKFCPVLDVFRLEHIEGAADEGCMRLPLLEQSQCGQLQRVQHGMTTAFIQNSSLVKWIQWEQS